MGNVVLKKIRKADKVVENTFSEKGVSLPSEMDVFFKWLPAVYILITGITGMKTRSTLPDKVKIMALSQLLLNAFVESLKKLSQRRRPGTVSKLTSFPSRHTATAFCGAQILFDETKDHSKAVSKTGYLFAAMAGALRLNSKKHWLSDVVAGAVIGVLTARVATFIYKKL